MTLFSNNFRIQTVASYRIGVDFILFKIHKNNSFYFIRFDFQKIANFATRIYGSVSLNTMQKIKPIDERFHCDWKLLLFQEK